MIEHEALRDLYEYCYNDICGNSDQCSYHEAFNQGVAKAEDQLAAMSRDILVCQTKLVAQADLLSAASHALRSYQYGNATPDLAEDIADRIDAALAAPKEPKG